MGLPDAYLDLEGSQCCCDACLATANQTTVNR